MTDFKSKRKQSGVMMVSSMIFGMACVSMAEMPGKKIFDQNCVACHQLENLKEPIVGPSLIEMAHLYGADKTAFIEWCNSPGKKRANAIDMPSMAHIGDKGLAEIHAWILEATKGKKFVPTKVNGGDLYALDFKNLSGPRMQRIFMEDSSPASIVVSIDGKHSLCWDADSCRLRYAWQGGYIDGFPYWKGNGNDFAKVMGEIYYRAPEGLSSSLKLKGSEVNPQFKGYKVVEGLPIFSYSLGAVKVSESILNKNGSIVIKIQMQGNSGVMSYPLGDLTKTQFSHSAGKIENGALVLSAKEAAEFELNFKPNK